MYKIIFFLVVFGTFSCGVTEINYDAESVSITDEYDKKNRVDTIIKPYQSELNAEMQEVIAYAKKDFTKGRPNGVLNNWSADAVFNQLRNQLDDTPTFCLLNVGGLRNPLNKGEITLGDIYKLMPFDNEVVSVELPVEILDSIALYLSKSGGEPISGATMENGKIHISEGLNAIPVFRVITSDYLFKGGDRMNFFEEYITVEYSGVLLRDAMISEARKQKELNWNDEERIKL